MCQVMDALSEYYLGNIEHTSQFTAYVCNMSHPNISWQFRSCTESCCLAHIQWLEQLARSSNLTHLIAVNLICTSIETEWQLTPERLFVGGNEKRLVEAAYKQLNALPFYHSFWNRTTEPSLVMTAYNWMIAVNFFVLNYLLQCNCHRGHILLYNIFELVQPGSVILTITYTLYQQLNSVVSSSYIPVSYRNWRTSWLICSNR